MNIQLTRFSLYNTVQLSGPRCSKVAWRKVSKRPSMATYTVLPGSWRNCIAAVMLSTVYLRVKAGSCSDQAWQGASYPCAREGKATLELDATGPAIPVSGWDLLRIDCRSAQLCSVLICRDQH